MMIRTFPLFILVSLLAGCATYQPRVDYDHAFQFAGLTTYAWAPQPKPEEVYQSLDETRIRRAFEAALAAKGLHPVALDKAQVWVDIGYSVNRRYETRTAFYGYYGWHPYWWGLEPDVYVEERDESRLNLLFINPRTKAVVWAGQSAIRYYEELPPEKRIDSLIGQVNAIMAQYPPR